MGSPWTCSEDNTLKNLWKNRKILKLFNMKLFNIKFKEIHKYTSRTDGAINKRRHRLGLIEHKYLVNREIKANAKK